MRTSDSPLFLLCCCCWWWCIFAHGDMHRSRSLPMAESGHQCIASGGIGRQPPALPTPHFKTKLTAFREAAVGQCLRTVVGQDLRVCVCVCVCGGSTSRQPWEERPRWQVGCGEGEWASTGLRCSLAPLLNGVSNIAKAHRRAGAKATFSIQCQNVVCCMGMGCPTPLVRNTERTHSVPQPSLTHTNQPTHQPTNRPTDPPTHQPTHQPTNPPTR